MTTGSTPRWTRFGRALAWGQALYFLSTGIWPWVSIQTFMAVTGPKTDIWLVQLFGALVCVPAVVLIHALRADMPTAAVRHTARGSAIVLMLGDIYFVAKGTISPVYLVDAGIQALLVMAWPFAVARVSEARP